MVRAVEDVLEEIGAGGVHRLLALNKADLVDADRRLELGFRHREGLLLSAETGEGLEALGERIEAEFRRGLRPVDPKPPAIRVVVPSSWASTTSGSATGATTSWAIRSPGVTSNAALRSVLSSSTRISPR